jgi:NAD-dependent SIR2 family protein deacetylase
MIAIKLDEWLQAPWSLWFIRYTWAILPLVYRCTKEGCGGLLRPHVVWFGESLDPDVMNGADQELDQCDLCLVVRIHIV